MISFGIYNLCIFFGGMMFERFLRSLDGYAKEYLLYKRYHSNDYDPE
jgi:hypothetical protein